MNDYKDADGYFSWTMAFYLGIRPGVVKRGPSDSLGISEGLQMVDDSQVVEWGLVCE